jgi:hypothetical protein
MQNDLRALVYFSILVYTVFRKIYNLDSKFFR